MPLPGHFRTFGIETVTIVHNPKTADETRLEAEAHIQGESGFFGVETPIYEGDIVERPDPRGGMERRLVATVNINDPKGPAFRDMVHTKVTWGKAPPARVAPVRRLTVENLHSHVMTAVG
ncbi:hypothetical protein [Ornithinimicrobium sp. Y1694]|uniref:hypothetical protein n=1 Tax=Ornithinimicrobium sp. Y1694 TaxID=3418590 RepID=UPI003CEB7409